MEALQTATRNPADYLHMLNSRWTIEKGKIADLVLLDANPLEDIRNTRKIEAVVVGGHLIPKSEIQKMQTDAEADIQQASGRSVIYALTTHIVRPAIVLVLSFILYFSYRRRRRQIGT